jgi:hypothetical protein
MCAKSSKPHAQSSREQMMTILDNDLVNVLHAERRLEAAHERIRRKLVTVPRDRAPTFSASRVAASWLRAWAR